MSLSCSCDSDGYMELYTCVMRKSRKERRCWECGATIRKGELYEHQAWKFEGDFGYKNSCEKCGDLAASLMDVGFCWPEGDLAFAYREYLEEYVNGAVRYDEENDVYIYPANHLIDERGDPRKWVAA
jgi:hypothetical protein